MPNVMVMDKNLKRGESTVRTLKANGYDARCMNSSGPDSKGTSLEWPDVMFMADHPASQSFKVLYRGSGPPPSKDDTYFFLELSRYLIREVAVDFPFRLN